MEKQNNIQPGDLLYFDKQADGKQDHATIITKVDNDGNIYYSGNTLIRHDEPFSEDNFRNYKEVSIIKLKD